MTIVEELKKKVLAGGEVTREEALELTEAPLEELAQRCPVVLLPLPACKRVTVLCNWTERIFLISISKKRCYAARKRIQLLMISH